LGTAIPGKRWDFAVPLPSRLPAKITGAFNSGTHPTGWKWWVEGCVLAGFDDYPIRLQHHPTFKAGCHVACLHASQGLPVPSRLSGSGLPEWATLPRLPVGLCPRNELG